MKYFIFSILFLLTVLFYILEISFKSFSKISLAGFLDDLKNKKIKKFDFVKNYDKLQNSLRAFSSFFQLCLFIFTFFLLENFMKAPPIILYKIILLIFSFLLFFNLFLYSISYSNREKILKKIIFLYHFPWIFFYPANIIFSMFTKKRLKDKKSEPDDLSDKELEIFFEESTKEGVLEKEDKEMIESVIEFGDTLVKEIMTPLADMIYVNINTNIKELANIININKKSRYPVISGRIDNIEGIILSKDVFNYWDKKDFHIKKILRETFFVPETMRIFELLKELQKAKQKFAVVVDEFGGISGVVTMEDIIEEIVGEIQDEYDDDIEQIVKEKDYFIVNGNIDISQLGDELKIIIKDDEDFQTLAGLLSYKLGKIPGIADKIKIENYTLEVIETEKNRIKKVKIYIEKE